jgi:suppressor of ftsI
MLVAVVTLAAVATLALLASLGSARTEPAAVAAPVSGAPLLEPNVLRSHHGVLNATLIARSRRVMVAGRLVMAKVYNGSFVGPTLLVRPGDLVRVRLVNDLAEPTNLHFHGLEVSPSGHGDNIFVSVAPGRSYRYSFRLPRDAATGTFWYHSHEMASASGAQAMAMPGMTMLSEEQVFDGLSGMLEVDGLARRLPRSLQHAPQRFLAFRDAQIQDGSVVSSAINSNAPTIRTVDGQLDPRMTIAPGQTQIWHLANVGADIFYALHLDGHSFDVIAQDGHPVIHPWRAETLVLPPGKRFDVLVRGGRAGRSALRTLKFSEGDDLYPDRSLATLVTTGARALPSVAPQFIESSPDLRLQRAARRRLIIFSENPAGTSFFIDGRSYDPNRIDVRSKLNTVEDWTIVNHTDERHPFHMHTYPMQVVGINGVPQIFNGYQDEVVLPPHGYVEVRIDFRRYTGITVFHCHILAHEDAGMMANIQVSR